MPEPITIRSLPARERTLTAAIDVIPLPMTAHDRRRVRRLVDAADGACLALELATGTVLHPGQVLHQTASRAYVVTAALEDVLVARPRDIAEAARIGHLIGNLHRDIEADGDDIVALADVALADRLRRAGVLFVADRRPFHGRAAGDHAH
jgi:urease accessory protein